MPALDAHHHRLRLYDDLAPGSIGSRLLAGFIKADSEAQLSYALSRGAIRHLVALGEDASEVYRTALEGAETFYASPDMVTLTEHASQTMPNETLSPSDLPADLGFLWIPTPISHFDIRGKLLRTSAFLWHAQGDTLRITFFVDRNDPVDEINQSLRASHEEFMAMPRLQVQQIIDLHFNEELPISIDTRAAHEVRQLGFEVDVTSEVVKDEQGRGVRIAWTVRNPHGVQITDEDLATHHNISMSKIPHPTVAFLITFFRLCQQSLTRTVKEPPDRALRRRMERVKLTPKPVTVITLRHMSAAPSHGGNPVNWSHRWTVRQHWRKQPCKVDGVWTTRAVLIHPYVKGPDDKPLLVREHVHALTR